MCDEYFAPNWLWYPQYSHVSSVHILWQFLGTTHWVSIADVIGSNHEMSVIHFRNIWCSFNCPHSIKLSHMPLCISMILGVCVQCMWNAQVKGQQPLWHSFVYLNVWHHNGATIATIAADGFARIIDKHCNHPSIIKIREHIKAQHYFYFTAVNNKHIDKIMQKMDPKKAQGCDNIPSKLLRLGASGISSYVSQLVNHCLHVCEFPDTMKLADVSSLYKKNDDLKKDNYRPMSVLPSLSKIFMRESWVNNCLIFLTKSSLLCCQLSERHTAVSLPFWIWSSILKNRWTMVNMWHA